MMTSVCIGDYPPRLRRDIHLIENINFLFNFLIQGGKDENAMKMKISFKINK